MRCNQEETLIAGSLYQGTLLNAVWVPESVAYADPVDRASKVFPDDKKEEESEAVEPAENDASSQNDASPPSTPPGASVSSGKRSRYLTEDNKSRTKKSRK